MKRIFVVSCQALKEEPLFGGNTMLKMAKAALSGGADWIRTSQIENIEMIRDGIDAPIIGIIKKHYQTSDVFITPTNKELSELIETKVDIIAIDATLRKRPKESLEEMVKFFKNNKSDNQKIMADCSNIEDIKNAIKLGFDFIGTTLFGYTKETVGKTIKNNNFSLLKEIRALVKGKLIVEGGIDTPEEAKQAFDFGADIVVVGAAITRPRTITKRFVNKINEEK